MEFQVHLALEGFASKMTVPNYREKGGADFGPPKWMFCPITVTQTAYLDFCGKGNDKGTDNLTHEKSPMNTYVGET